VLAVDLVRLRARSRRLLGGSVGEKLQTSSDKFVKIVISMKVIYEK
jgi:hypothetical protein